MAKILQINQGNPCSIPREFLKYLEFFSHNFGPRNARKLIKGSKDAYYSLESNIALSHQIGLLDQLMIS